MGDGLANFTGSTILGSSSVLERLVRNLSLLNNNLLYGYCM